MNNIKIYNEPEQKINMKNGSPVVKGEDGRGIDSIQVKEVIDDKIYLVILYSDGTEDTLILPRGEKGEPGPPGEDGVGIKEITTVPSGDGKHTIIFIHTTDGNIYETYVENGTSGRGIKKMAYYDTNTNTGEIGIYVWYTDESTEIIWIPGLKGEDGVGIENVESIPFGDEYSNLRIKLTDGRETEFSIYNGYTPVRGTDYWTDADKAEIKSYVDEAILGGAW